MPTEEVNAPRHEPGDSVRITRLGLTGTIVSRKLDEAGRWCYIVDRKHGNGTMRQHFDEGELE